MIRLNAILARLREQRGVAALEFVLVSFLLIGLLYGILMFGFIFAMDHNLEQAAAEGARQAVSQPDSTLALASDPRGAYAANAAKDHLTFQAAKDHATVTGSVINCPSDASIRCVKVDITYDYKTYPLIPALLGLNVAAPDQLSAEAIVELQ
jgi:Flp pilus assembly protein TadG